MTQKLLDTPKIGSHLQMMRGKRVAKRVNSAFLLNARVSARPVKDFLRAANTQVPFPARAIKYIPLTTLAHHRTCQCLARLGKANRSSVPLEPEKTRMGEAEQAIEADSGAGRERPRR